MIVRWLDPIKARYRGEEGQTMVEYGVIIAMIAVALVAALGSMGQALKPTFEEIACTLNKTC